MVDVALDLSEWVDAKNFQLKFGDYWPSDGWGALLERTQVVADGNTYIDIEAETED